ncbi:39S ribosomal protein L3, mitochondrial-like [Chrysoperla carnea]|uniref:39S ribosomal protein L3, mitochondrial-like n=1 Tax=Chrysoperla carnea TaxID=189513 RepID=UPI001D08AF00|nr:39S ribosomal protein L3, mitochondrial-like [Chrysoperla carnea]XP_044732488.1 39S ribosomal protein L3, mitochondrial-like [Chrysoperla carnea]
MAMASITSSFLNLQKNILEISVQTCITQQIRGKKRLNIPKLRYPTWFVRKERVLHDEKISQENSEFIKDVISEKFGPPAIIGGIQTYNTPLKTEPLKSVEWTPGLRRTGTIAKKIGIYPMWLKDGTKISTTLLQIVDNHVVKYIPPDEYHQTRERVIKIRGTPKGCVLVGAESDDPSLYTREYCGLFEKSGLPPKKFLARFFISPSAALSPGTPLTALHYRVGDYIDVRGKTVDRGFQGVIKRWGFKGGRASHGTTKTHRRPGNIGGGGEKGRVWPGTKMPGHMGNTWRMLKGLKIWRINTKYNVLWVSGQNVPGSTNSYVYIYDTILPSKPVTNPPFPTHVDKPDEVLPENIYDEEVHRFSDPTITFQPE